MCVRHAKDWVESRGGRDLASLAELADWISAQAPERAA